MNNVTFNNCNFKDCNISINSISSSSESKEGGALASLVVLGGMALAFNPVLMGTVISTAVGVALVGTKTLAIGGLGYSALKTVFVLNNAKTENLLLENTNDKQEYIETTYKVKDE